MCSRHGITSRAHHVQMVAVARVRHQDLILSGWIASLLQKGIAMEIPANDSDWSVCVAPPDHGDDRRTDCGQDHSIQAICSLLCISWPLVAVSAFPSRSLRYQLVACRTIRMQDENPGLHLCDATSARPTHL